MTQSDTGQFYWKLENKEIMIHSFIHSCIHAFACSVHIDLLKACCGPALG